MGGSVVVIRTPDQRLRVFISSTMRELAEERAAARRAVERLRLTPVLFELGARPHPPRELYLSYLAQSDVFIGVYWQSYGWVAPGEAISALEDEFRAAAGFPRLIYVREPARERTPELDRMLRELVASGVSYRQFTDTDELEDLIADDLAVLVSERFAGGDRPIARPRGSAALRAESDAFIGREALLQEISNLVTTPSARLVTLIGPGGVGKTRLARRVARTCGHRFPHGTHFVELVSVRTKALVTSAITEALGLSDVPGASAIEQVATSLSGGPSLLVLDNFEHVIAASNVIAELLILAPELTVLVTSREVLRLSGEHVVDVPPMDIPDPHSTVEALEVVDSVALLLDRARAAWFGFAPTEKDLRAVAEIVRRLDGLPLAIELAAARCRLLEPAALLERLGSRLALGGGPRNVPDHQRTMRDTITWSYDLLPSEQPDLFDRLGVFMGGFGLDSATAVAPDGVDVLDGLAGLCDRSLVHTEGSAGGVLRFGMLETIREFAVERLDQRGIGSEVGRRHAEHFLWLANELEPDYERGKEHRIVERSTADHANFAAAADWFLADGDAASAVRIAVVLWRTWWVRARFREGIARMQAVRSNALLSDHDRAHTLFIEGVLAFALNSFDSSYPLVSEAVELFESVGDRRGVAQALVVHGVIRASVEPRNGEKELQRTVELAYEIGDKWTAALATVAYGSVLVNQERFNDAVPVLEASADHNRVLGTEVLRAYSLAYLGRARVGLGELDAAQAVLSEALRRSAAMQSPEAVARILSELAALPAEQGDAQCVAKMLGAADAIRASVGVPVWLPDEPYVVALSHRVEEALGQQRFEEAFEAGQRLTLDEALTLM
jgi:predicted ATPase/predicted nucleic acid-binding protein